MLMCYYSSDFLGCLISGTHITPFQNRKLIISWSYAKTMARLMNAVNRNSGQGANGSRISVSVSFWDIKPHL